MKSRLTPYYLDLVYDAALKSFWRKNALRKFLRESGISENFLSTWEPEESKRQFLDRLFEKLLKTEKGRLAVVRISKNLMEQKSFPDLQNWEDSEVKIQQAYKSVDKLRIYHNKQEESIASETQKQKARDDFYKKQQDITRSQKSLLNLNERLNDLGQKIGSQKAGYEFQDWFYDLLDFCEITNRRPYVHDGRQIDGSLTHDGTTYLIELKFTSEQAGANDIDSFYKKVVTKADNTMGIMVSISGYSSVAIKEASGEKTPLLLMDHSHVYYALSGIMSLGDIIDRVRRHASQTSEAYLPSSKFNL
jgi:hypothetical protein